MVGDRTFPVVAALAGVAAAIAVLAGLPLAKADELADLRANQELLQQRLDQLAQAPPAALGGPLGIGSFPRSFLIPGTDTSLRIGGQAVGSELWYIKGQAPGGSLNGTGGLSNNTDVVGGTGNLAGIPLKLPPAANATAVGVARSRSSTWIFSARTSQIFLDAHLPSAYGEITAFVSMDFVATTFNTIVSGVGSVVSGYIPRLREGYATIGGLVVGQTNGTFRDTDSEPETLDFGGQTGAPGISRVAQVRYTYPLGQGLAISAAAENPDPQTAGPFGQFDFDTNAIPSSSACLVPISVTTGGAAGTVVTNITNACLGNAAFFDALQPIFPNIVLRSRLDQPWGHLQFGMVMEGYGLNDGRFLNKSYIGYGGSVSGHFFTWDRDSIGGGIAGGNGIGDYLGSGAGLASNFGGTLAGDAVNATNSTSKFTTARAAYDATVLAQTVIGFSARIYYTHWWNDQLRSTVDFSDSHNDLPALIQASGRGATNKDLALTHLNLIWSPVAFLDLGIEGAWGHRQVVSNLRGNSYTVQTAMKVRF